MTSGTPLRRLGYAALAAAVIAGYAVAIVWLRRTTVPAGLRLGGVDPRRYFSAALLHRASTYRDFLAVDFLLAQIALLVALALYARRGARLMRESAAGRIGTGMMLAMLGFAVVWLAQLPFGIAGLWWQRRYGVSDQGYAGFILGNWFALGAKFLFVSLAILIVMGLAGPLRERWWIAATPVFVGLALLQVFVSPYLIPELHRLQGPRLRADAQRLEQAEGLHGIPIYVQNVHGLTTAPNAEAAGLGPTRRVILWDTLFGGRFDARQLDVVVAHELGHLRRDHLLKEVVWYALFALPMALLIALATRRRGGMYEPAAVPVALLVLALLQLLALPLHNVITRRYESEADWIALQTTRDPVAARTLYQRLGTISLAQPSPSSWSYVLRDSHPTVAQRIAMTLAWQQRR